MQLTCSTVPGSFAAGVELLQWGMPGAAAASQGDRDHWHCVPTGNGCFVTCTLLDSSPPVPWPPCMAAVCARTGLQLATPQAWVAAVEGSPTGPSTCCHHLPQTLDWGVPQPELTCCSGVWSCWQADLHCHWWPLQSMLTQCLIPLAGWPPPSWLPAPAVKQAEVPDPVSRLHHAEQPCRPPQLRWTLLSLLPCRTCLSGA